MSAPDGPSHGGNGSVASAPALGRVEVQKESGSKVWYCGSVTDFSGKDKLTVVFERNVWPKAEFPLNRVRKPPTSTSAELERFDPAIGDEVELCIDATEHAPAGWATATVKKMKHDFYFVARTTASVGECSEAIVEKDMLRPPSTSKVFSSGLKQEIYKLPSGLQAWSTSPDALGCFGHIEEQSNLALICVQKDSLKLFGDPKAISRAKMLLEVHVKHQIKIQDFQDKRERGLRALESRRSRIEGTGYKHSVEVKVDPSFIPRIIGKGGEAIKSLQERHDVSVRILESDANADSIVRIFGNSAESVERARADVEFVEESIDVDPATHSWIVGRGGKTIQGFRDSCNLMYARLDRNAHRLILCGTKQGVQEAIAMFESHIMYYPVFKQMDEEMGKIISQLEEYGDYDARYEWNWFRDQDDEEYGGTNASVGGSVWDGGARKSTKGKTKGKGRGGAEIGRGGRAASVAATWTRPEATSKPGGTGPSGRRMGKKGVRS